MQLILEPTVGKYGQYWIEYIKNTNINLYINLLSDLEKPIIKMAREVNRRTIELIDKLLKSLDNAEEKNIYIRAEEIAVNQIIYNR